MPAKVKAPAKAQAPTPKRQRLEHNCGGTPHKKLSSGMLQASPSPAPRSKLESVSHALVCADLPAKLAATARIAATPVPRKHASASTAVVCKDANPTARQVPCVPESVVKILRGMLDILQVAGSGAQQHTQPELKELMGMAGEALTGAQADLLRGWDEAKAAEIHAEELLWAAERRVEGLNQKSSRRGDTIESRRGDFASGTKAFKQQTEAVNVARTAQEECEAELEAAKRHKDLLARVAADYVKPLTKGMQEGEAKTILIERLTAALRELGVDRAVVAGWSQAFGADPGAERDAMQQIQKELSTRNLAVRNKLDQATQSRAACAASLSKAQDAFDTAKEKQQSGAHRLWNSKADQKAAEEALEAGRAKTRTLAQDLATAKGHTAVAAQQWLEGLQAGSLAAHLLSRERHVPTALPLTEA